MSDTVSPREPFGIGAVITESFSIFFKRIVSILIVGFATFFVTSLISAALLGLDVATGQADPFGLDAEGEFVGPQGGLLARFLLSTLLGVVAYAVMTAVVVLLAYDAKLGRPVRLAGYFGAALPVILPIAVLNVVVTLLVAIGLMLLVLPGVWIAAVFSVVVPVVVIERAGFSAMGRSATLTKDYRWSIVGLFVVIVLIAIVVAMVFGGFIGLVAFTVFDLGGTSTGLLGSLALLVINAFGSAFSYGFTSIALAMIYSRLRELKEGVGVASLAEVFR